MDDILEQMMNFHEYIKGVLGGLYPFVAIVVKIIGVILLAIIMAKVGSFTLKKIFQKQKTFKYKMDTRRIDTLSTLFQSMFRYSIYILSGVSILTIVAKTFNLESILAAAGIGGIALGFGAQSLIKDVISGAFIVFEDQYNVGDRVTLENLTGNVEEFQLRVTKLRNFNGDLYIIPNGEIKKVINHSRGNKVAIVDIPIAYSSDLNKAIEIAERICKAVKKEFAAIVEEPKVLGVTELGEDKLNLRVIAKTIPDEQWEVERRIRKLITNEYSKEKIEFFDKYRVVLADKDK